MMPDVVEKARKLMRLESVTPRQEGCFDLITSWLEPLGFSCECVPFHDVTNFYAKWSCVPSGEDSIHICFVGHVDVVPAADREHWKHDPFSATVEDGVLYGRGAVDMKGAIAAYICALERFIKNEGDRPAVPITLSVLLTSDEEGPAEHGIRRMVDWLKQRGERFSLFLVGEPSNPFALGEMIKVGRRGSLSFSLTLEGVGGHVAYPKEANNPIPCMLTVLNALLAEKWDDGCHEEKVSGGFAFDASHLEIISVDVENGVGNVIPSHITAKGNIRFSPQHSFQTLSDDLQNIVSPLCEKKKIKYTFSFTFGAEPFVCEPNLFVDTLLDVVFKHTGRHALLSTTGGTSDGRFVKELGPVIEFGLMSAQAHKRDEHVRLSDLACLVDIYENFIVKVNRK